MTIHPPWAPQAAHALVTAALQCPPLDILNVGLLVEDFGSGQLSEICLAWVDSAMGVRPDGRHIVELCWHDLATGAAMDAEDTPPPVRWAGRFIAARLADDSLTAEALWKTGTDEQFIDGVVALLGICGSYLARQHGITTSGNPDDRPPHGYRR